LLATILEYLDKTMTTTAGENFYLVVDFVRQPNPLTARSDQSKGKRRVTFVNGGLC
jgi:hypothetical protein